MINLLDGRVILLVDDEDDVRQVISSMLRRVSEKVKIRTARNGKDALAEMRQEPPDVVVADLDMPVMNGYELIEQIRSQRDTRLIPILVLTALGQQDAELEALDAGANDLMTKPVGLNELVLRIRALIRLKIQIDELQQECTASKNLVVRLSQALKNELGMDRARQVLAEVHSPVKKTP